MTPSSTSRDGIASLRAADASISRDMCLVEISKKDLVSMICICPHLEGHSVPLVLHSAKESNNGWHPFGVIDLSIKSYHLNLTCSQSLPAEPSERSSNRLLGPWQ